METLQFAGSIVEAQPQIVSVLDDADDGLRFRQLVGVSVKLKMQRLGWTTTGRKGSMARYTDRFGSAEMYERADTALDKDPTPVEAIAIRPTASAP